MRDYSSAEAPPPGEAAAVALPEITFKLDGQEFRVVDMLTGEALLEWSELAQAAADDVPFDSPEGAAFVYKFIRASLGADEYLRFRRHVRRMRTPAALILEIVSDIQQEMSAAVERVTDRPTGQSSPSSPGDEDAAGERSRIISLARGDVTFAPPPDRPETRDHKAKGGGKRTPRRAIGG